MKAQDLIKLNIPPKIVIYGKAGCGKTALVSQASNGYMMDFDGGMRTAATLKDKFTDLRGSIEFDTYKDANPATPKQWLLAKERIFKIAEEVAKGKWKHDALVIDSWTGLCQSVYYQVLYQSNRALGRPEIQHWGLMTSEVENILTVLTSMNTLVILTAHEASSEEDEITKVEIASITHNHRKKVPWSFDEVWHMTTKPAPQNKTSYIITGRSSYSIMARTRSGIDELNVNEIGLSGLLEKMGYIYGRKDTSGNGAVGATAILSGVGKDNS